jgi:galactokinase
VSCDELDFLVDFSMVKEYVVGSRMMGGGFGGCVINLIDSDFMKEYISNISGLYRKKFSLDLSSDIVSISKGLSYG